jgi:hypothetical protein
MKNRTEQAECAACGHVWQATFEDCGFDPILKCPVCEGMSGQVVLDSVPDEEEGVIRCIFCGRKIKKEGVCPTCNKTRRI